MQFIAQHFIAHHILFPHLHAHITSEKRIIYGFIFAKFTTNGKENPILFCKA